MTPEAVKHSVDVQRWVINAKAASFGGLCRYDIKRVRDDLAAAEWRMYKSMMYYSRLCRENTETLMERFRKGTSLCECKELLTWYRQGYTVLHNLIEMANAAIALKD